MTPDQERAIKEDMIEKIIPLIWANEDIEEYSLAAYSDDGLLEVCMKVGREIAEELIAKHRIKLEDGK